MVAIVDPAAMFCHSSKQSSRAIAIGVEKLAETEMRAKSAKVRVPVLMSHESANGRSIAIIGFSAKLIDQKRSRTSRIRKNGNLCQKPIHGQADISHAAPDPRRSWDMKRHRNWGSLEMELCRAQCISEGLLARAGRFIRVQEPPSKFQEGSW